MATCEFCGQDLKGVRWKVDDLVLVDTSHGLKEGKVRKILPSKRYRVELCDYGWNYCIWSEGSLFLNEEEFVAAKEARVAREIEELVEGIDQMREEFKAAKLVKARFAEMRRCGGCRERIMPVNGACAKCGSTQLEMLEVRK